MKRNNTILSKIKASLTACLFLFPFAAQPQHWDLSLDTQKNYDQALNLNFDTNQFSTVNSDHHLLYIQSLAEALEILLTEDPERFSLFEERIEKRIDILKKNESASALFVMAEIRLQWSFVYLKFGKEFDAAWSLRQAYQLSKQCKKSYPEFQPIHKTSGILNIMIGSVPEKYDWILSVLGMEGDIGTGIKELTELQTSTSPFALEARLLLSLIEGFIFQKTDEGLQHLTIVLKQESPPALALVLATALSIKNSQSELALNYIHTIEKRRVAFTLSFLQYLKGEVYLQKAMYPNAINAFNSFINLYTGQNHLKDAYYKAGICYWLDQKEEKANQYFAKAEHIGRAETEADKYAARSLQDHTLPNQKLTRIRYATDGGYYNQAKLVIASVTNKDLATERDRVEFYYRQGRLYHKTNDWDKAIEFYKKTILDSNELTTYFAPNACLQLGYIYDERKDFPTAEFYYRKALTYKNHEYKNSIDSKARSALAQLDDHK